METAAEIVQSLSPFPPLNGKSAGLFERFQGERRFTFRLADRCRRYISDNEKRRDILEAARNGDILALRTYTEDLMWDIAAVLLPAHITAVVALQVPTEGSLDAVDYLLSKGVPTEAADDWGRTALDWAASCGGLEVALVLVEHGAVVTSRALRAAEIKGFQVVADWLREYVKRTEEVKNGCECVDVAGIMAMDRENDGS
ncbi:hypothetical protein N657DRAFT_675607 [Parathielavia appendiculata]|uniref:Uncharacterized protein n=1 Tax=Parathielavia appendiculata TaxID=2587402 RepID=A0AAN6TPM6_9PEZI|nr:hypothetical protein N657DRAFT_675607 [Parathielavia appendiculata]